MMRILLTGAYGYTDEQCAIIKQLGFETDFVQFENDYIETPEIYDAVICNGLFLHNDIARFSKLKHIQLTSAGYDRVPIDYIRSHNIGIYNAGGVYSNPMAEFALCGVLQVFKKSWFFAENQKQHIWVKNREVLELCGKNVLIVGCGSVGTACAKRFSAFECNVFGVDVMPTVKPEYSGIFPLEKTDELLKISDVVVLSLPLTDSTRNFISDARFEHFKDGAVLVNIARGGIVEVEALKKAIGNKLGGAVLDVFENEPLDEESPLWDMENVIITPHNSFVGDGNNERLFKLIIENLKKFKESVSA